jgi:hypothetical protein
VLKSAGDLRSEVENLLPDNTTAEITPSDVRTVSDDLIDSVHFLQGVQLPSDEAAQELIAEINALLPDNTTGLITPLALRTVLSDLVYRLNGALTTIPPAALFGSIPRTAFIQAVLTATGSSAGVLVANIPGLGNLLANLGVSYALTGTIAGSGTLSASIGMTGAISGALGPRGGLTVGTSSLDFSQASNSANIALLAA